MRTPEEWVKLIDLSVEEAKKEILDDIRDGVVPNDIRTFSALHDYVDANCYGRLCDEDWIERDGTGDMTEATMNAANEVQQRIERWLQERIKKQ